MEENNILNNVIRDLLVLTNPIKEAAINSDYRKSLLNELGWNFNSIDGIPIVEIENTLSTINTVIDNISVLVDSPPETIESISEALDNLKLLFQSIEDIKDIFVGVTLPIGFIDEFQKIGKDLSDLLIGRYLERHYPTFYYGLCLLGIVDPFKVFQEIYNGDEDVFWKREMYSRPEFHYDNIGDLFSNPIQYFKEQYFPVSGELETEEEAQIMSNKLFPLIEAFLGSLGCDVWYGLNTDLSDYYSAENYALVESSLSKTLTFVFKSSDNTAVGASIRYVSQDEGGFGLVIVPFGELEFDVALKKWYVKSTLSASIEGFSINSDGVQFPDSFTDLDLGVNLQVARLFQDDNDVKLLLGNPSGTHLRVGGVGFNAFGNFNGDEFDYGGLVHINQSKLVIGGNQEGIVDASTPKGFHLDFDFSLGWSKKNGLFLGGNIGGKLETKIPFKLKLGPVTVNDIKVKLNLENGNIETDITTNLNIKIGPVVLTTNEIGVTGELSFPGTGGNLGPANIDFGFKEPTGIGISINAGLVKGTGFLDFNKDIGEYTGLIHVKIKDLIDVTAIGVLNTKMPDGSKGFSFTTLISATGLNIPLVAGFNLDGLGGLLGIHRTVDTNFIRAGLKSKTLDSILFPENIETNLPQVISDFKTAFPIQRNKFLFGPMARITWGKKSKVCQADLGIVIEFGSQVRLILLGDLNIGLGKKDEEALVINIAFLGEINIPEKRILFDATIYDSRLANFTIEGDMAFRLFWGKQKGFIMTVGGFHPDYTPPQHLLVNDVNRIRINFFTEKDYRLFIECYFAITSNTVQFGALADLKFKLKKFEIKGQLGFDALFQFNPFRFSVGVHAYIGVFWGSSELLGIGFSGKIVGTSPWSINGSGHFKLLFISYSASFKKTWGDEGNALLEALDVETLVANELALDKNWKVIMPDNKTKLVSYKVSDPESSTVYVHPLGELSVEQSVAPMDINLEHYENHAIDGASRFKVNQMTIGSQVITDFKYIYDDFAPAQFFKMTDKEKLASKSYVPLKAGVQVSGDTDQDFESYVTCVADYDRTLLDVDREKERDEFYVHNFLNHYQFVKSGRHQRSSLSKKNRIKKEQVLNKAVTIPKRGFAIVDDALNYYNNDAVTYTLNSRVEAQDIINQLIENDSDLEGELNIVPEFELEV